MLSKELLDILVCPWCRKQQEASNPLRYDPRRQTLTCLACRRVYPVRDDIPVLLIEEARIEEAPPGA